MLYRGPFREPRELEESEQRVSPWTLCPALLAGVGERAPGIHLSSGDKSCSGADVTVRLRMLKLQLSISAQASDQNKHAQLLVVIDFKIKMDAKKKNYRESLERIRGGEKYRQRLNIDKKRLQLNLHVSCWGLGRVLIPVYSAVFFLRNAGKANVKNVNFKRS